MIINGYSYYSLNLEQRSFHRDHELFKPSGLVGHGLGIIGLILILIGVFSYMIRKRTKKLHHFGLLRNWLEFHIFLTILGPAMIIFHTAFKFGGIVAISFWSMIAVVISGVIGRYIYVRIPRTIEGRELGMSEISMIKKQLLENIKESFREGDEIIKILNQSYSDQLDSGNKSFLLKLIAQERQDRKMMKKIKSELRKRQFTGTALNQILDLCKKEIALNRRKEILTSLQDIFKNWHVIHLPFAFIMISIAIVHISVAVLFGYRWIF